MFQLLQCLSYAHKYAYRKNGPGEKEAAALHKSLNFMFSDDEVNRGCLGGPLFFACAILSCLSFTRHGADAEWIMRPVGISQHIVIHVLSSIMFLPSSADTSVKFLLCNFARVILLRLCCANFRNMLCVTVEGKDAGLVANKAPRPTATSRQTTARAFQTNEPPLRVEASSSKRSP